jgi:hypothetical protein
MPPTEARAVLGMPRFCNTEDRLARISTMSRYLSRSLLGLAVRELIIVVSM